MKNALTVIGDLLLFFGLAAFLWCATVLLRAYVVQIRGAAVLNRERPTQSTDRPEVDHLPIGPSGKMTISRIGVSSVILEGIDHDILASSMGHVPGTAMPGSNDNVVLAAYRDTFLRGLEHIHIGDDIRLALIGGDKRLPGGHHSCRGPDRRCGPQGNGGH